MKKTFKGFGVAALVGAIIVGLASNASAFIVVTWGQTAPTMKLGEVAYSGLNGVDDGGLVQLIWSSDDIIDPVDIDGSTTGNDQVLDSGVFSSPNAGSQGFFLGHAADSYLFTDLIGVADNAALVAGSVYMRVFSVGSLAIGVGTDYLTGGFVADLNDSPANADAYAKTDYTGGAPAALDMTIVPEPTTFALFGLGLATLVARRRRRR